MESNSNALLIIKLLQETTTLSTVSNFLKNKGLHHSASSWDQLRSDRILPALAAHEIDINDLVNLLRIAEEYGRQHVFLYRCSDEEKIRELLDEERIKEVLEIIGLTDILNEPKILEQPESPTIVDVRLGRNENGALTGLIIKIVESRISEKFVEERVNNDTISKIYKRIPERVVNVIKLRVNGDLELRIASQESKSYRSNVDDIWRLINDILPRNSFSEIYLNKAKECLWEDRHILHDLIRFSDSTLRNDNGTAVKAATGSQESNLFDDEGANNCMETFFQYDAHCETHNIWFLVKDGESIPSREVHVLLSGELNEFAITPHSSEENYEYVINQLKRLNN